MLLEHPTLKLGCAEVTSIRSSSPNQATRSVDDISGKVTYACIISLHAKCLLRHILERITGTLWWRYLIKLRLSLKRMHPVLEIYFYLGDPFFCNLLTYSSHHLKGSSQLACCPQLSVTFELAVGTRGSGIGIDLRIAICSGNGILIEFLESELTP